VVAEPGEEDGRGMFYPGRKAELVCQGTRLVLPGARAGGDGPGRESRGQLPETRVMVSANVSPRLVSSMTRGKRPR
jgi:hypothetical protein